MTNAIATNASITCHNKKERYKSDCFVLDAVSSAIILLLIITIVSHHYAKRRSKPKRIDTLTI